MPRYIRAGRVAGTAAVAALSALSLPHAAQAADTVSYSCRASVVTAQVAGGAVDDPVRAGNDTGACAEAVAGLPALTESVHLDSLATARTAYAAVNPGGAKPISAKPQAVAGVEGLDLAIPGTLSVGVARSTLSASCVSGAPVYTGRSEVANITLGGQPIVIDGVVQPITDALSDALGAVVSVRLNEQVDLPGGGKAVRAAHVKLLAGDGSGAPLADVIVAESRLTNNGTVCDPNSPPNSDDPGTDDGPTGNDTSGICPSGSVFDVSRKLCIIAVPGSQTATNPVGDLTGIGSVVVGKPYEGPKGGRVITLATARARFKSPCVRGKRGLPYVVIGNARGNRITGTNKGDRILGRGGSDFIDGGRGGDCIDGQRGGDKMTGGQGNDRVYGHAGNDAVNGDSNDDRLFGGRGNDSINAGYGKDRAFGGPGRDAINIATAGPRQFAFGGKGYDIIRMNPEDRVRGGERVHMVVRVKGS